MISSIIFHIQKIRRSVVVYSQSGCWKKRLVVVLCAADITPSVSDGKLRLVTKTDYRAAADIKEAIRNHLLLKIPTYMVPSVWIVVQDIPVMSSGQVNRKTVHQWGQDMHTSTQNEVLLIDDSKGTSSKDLTSLESTLRDIWRIHGASRGYCTLQKAIPSSGINYYLKVYKREFLPFY